VGASRRAAALAILNVIPQPVARLLFGNASSPNAVKGSRDELEGMLEAVGMTVLAPFEDSYITKHLAIAVLEAVVAKVVPELANGSAGSIAELLAERGVGEE